jgi:hypothetical protein
MHGLLAAVRAHPTDANINTSADSRRRTVAARNASCRVVVVVVGVPGGFDSGSWSGFSVSSFPASRRPAARGAGGFRLRLAARE